MGLDDKGLRAEGRSVHNGPPRQGAGEDHVIEINELTKYYGERKGVGPLTFRIEKGEVVGLLGLNGSGKTTTLRMLASDLLPTSGSMRVDGVDLVEEPEKVRPKIGYLPDRPPLYGEMDVREYLLFAQDRARSISCARTPIAGS